MNRKALALSVLIAIAAIVGPSHANAASIRPDHEIWCHWVDSPRPYKTGTAVGSSVAVSCTDYLDSANTRAQIEYKSSGGSWGNWGTGVTSYSTALLITVYDGAPGRSGSWYYRMEGTHFGQHGNMFALPTYYSSEARLTY